MKYKGICYQPLPPGYNPSTANKSCLYFGSDIADVTMMPVWSTDYSNSTGNYPNCRRDHFTLQEMGVTLLRLYDWEPRKHHKNFLDACATLGLGVLVPVSNYFLKGGFQHRQELIPKLIDSFRNYDGTDYHMAIKGIIIGNEPAVNGFGVQQCIEFTKDWAEIESQQFSNHREVPIGHPVDFGTYGGKYPAWGFWDPLLRALDPVHTRNLSSRLFLAPQSYDDKIALFENWGGTGKGYVDLTWEEFGQFKKPLLFTELGHDRTKQNYQTVVAGQLEGSIDYAREHPDRLLGTCFFQFADKVWMQGTSEGSFGAFKHSGYIQMHVKYQHQDFDFWDSNCAPGGSCAAEETMTLDRLEKTPLYDIVKKHYSSD